MSADESDQSSPGWRAIDVALDSLYVGREPLHWGTVISWRLGGPDPLDGISAYKNLDPLPHWHFISYGLTELPSQESNTPDLSAAGHELTLRQACNPSEASPPLSP